MKAGGPALLVSGRALASRSGNTIDVIGIIMLLLLLLKLGDHFPDYPDGTGRSCISSEPKVLGAGRPVCALSNTNSLDTDEVIRLKLSGCHQDMWEIVYL